jgi:hypothetical protein
MPLAWRLPSATARICRAGKSRLLIRSHWFAISRKCIEEDVRVGKEAGAGKSRTSTSGACRLGRMTELEEAELATGQGRYPGTGLTAPMGIRDVHPGQDFGATRKRHGAPAGERRGHKVSEWGTEPERVNDFETPGVISLASKRV